MKNELLAKYEELSTQAVQTYKHKIAEAKERQRNYDIDAREAIDEATAELKQRKSEINEAYNEELAQEIDKAKKAYVSAASVSSVEMSAVSGFIDDVKLQITMGNVNGAIDILENYADNLTSKQRAGAFAQLANELAAAGVDKSQLFELGRTYQNEDTAALKANVDDLNGIRYEDPTLPITTVQRAERNTQHRPTPGKTMPNDVKPLYEPDGE